MAFTLRQRRSHEKVLSGGVNGAGLLCERILLRYLLLAAQNSGLLFLPALWVDCDVWFHLSSFRGRTGLSQDVWSSLSAWSSILEEAAPGWASF